MVIIILRQELEESQETVSGVPSGMLTFAPVFQAKKTSETLFKSTANCTSSREISTLNEVGEFSD